MMLLVDNYDSFTYNLAHLFGALGAEVTVLRNDEIDADEAERLAPVAPRHLPRSRPARGARARRSRSSARLAPTTPTLGVCLGHQAIVEVFGGEVGYARELLHGKASPVRHDGTGLFAGLPEPFDAGRYHSLAATRLPDALEPTAYRGRRRGDGRAPPRAAGRRRPVPPRVGADAGRARARAQLPGGTAVIQAGARAAARRPRPHARRGARGDERDHARRGDAGADRRLPRRAAREGRDGGRDRRLRRGDARARAARAARSAPTSSTSSAPAATARTRSTSRPRRRSSPRPPAPASRSTATAPRRRRPAPRTCSRRSASSSSCRRSGSSSRSTSSASASSSRRRTIPR